MKAKKNCDSCREVGMCFCPGDLFSPHFHCPKFEYVDFDHEICDRYSPKGSDEPSSNRMYLEWFLSDAADNDIDYDSYVKNRKKDVAKEAK